MTRRVQRLVRKRTARVFAYGTLQDPQRLETVLGAVSRWRIVGRGTVRGALYNVGRYPALIFRRSAVDRVPGAVIELERGPAALERLDAYEGVADGLYRRRRCRVTMANSERTITWVYIYARPVTGLPRIDAWPPPG